MNILPQFEIFYSLSIIQRRNWYLDIFAELILSWCWSFPLIPILNMRWEGSSLEIFKCNKITDTRKFTWCLLTIPVLHYEYTSYLRVIHFRMNHINEGMFVDSYLNKMFCAVSNFPSHFCLGTLYYTDNFIFRRKKKLGKIKFQEIY